jgi:hypothetical protein
MLIWINGAFGVGKTAAARRLRERDRRWRVFDPEWVGYMLRANLTEVAFDDFQDLPAWRSLVPIVASEVIKHTRDDLVAVQTVLHEHYWQELASGFTEREITLVHVVLDADDETLRTRISEDREEPTALTWRLNHIPAYREARSWLLACADVVIDTARGGPTDIADTILAAVP